MTNLDKPKFPSAEDLLEREGDSLARHFDVNLMRPEADEPEEWAHTKASQGVIALAENNL